MKKRESTYDLLRIISAIAIIMIHVSDTWFVNAIEDISENGLRIENLQAPAVVCIYHSISGFAVPCFLLLSGAFILDNERNSDYKTFYSKTFSKIGVTTIVFSLLYILYRIPLCFVGEDRGISTLLKDIIRGMPMYHMWYLYMLIGIYAMVPVVLRFKNSISERNFYRISFVFLVLASASRWTTKNVRLMWDIGQSFEYLGYFMVGYSIRKMCKKRNNKKACLMILGGLLFELCAAGLEYKEIVDGVLANELRYAITSPYSPLIVSASVLIFYGFTLLNVNKNFTKCSSLTFYIYLIHAGVWDFMKKMLLILKGSEYLTDLNGAVWIAVFVIIVFTVSYCLSKLYLWIWNKLDMGKRITKFITRMVHLQIE